VDLPPHRIDWHGERDVAGIAAILSEAAVFAWPGCGEAYGLAYLEAQAAGLPVVACATAGVPEVVADGETGVLTPPADAAAFAAAIVNLLTDRPRRAAMGAAARGRVMALHSMDAAAAELATALDRALIDGRERGAE
jgi:glycosyltransferase involved in cell wall biosynthesis